MELKKTEIRVSGCKKAGELSVYLIGQSPEMPGHEKRPLVLICPGGGYCMTSDREAEPIAIQYLAKGYHAAVLRYSVKPCVFPEALLQLAASVKYLKDHAADYFVDSSRIFLQGFSAGAHLAACLGVFWNRPELSRRLGVKNSDIRPRAMVLGYPVISSGKYAHTESFMNLLGNEYQSRKEGLSLENQVDIDTIPAFLWHTADDEIVPVENSLLFFQSLINAGITAELHVYQHGPHGLALAKEETSDGRKEMVQPMCQNWMELACSWLAQFV